MTELGDFSRLIREAYELGVGEAFTRIFRRLRKEGVPVAEAGPRALDEARKQSARAQVAVTISKKEGKA